MLRLTVCQRFWNNCFDGFWCIQEIKKRRHDRLPSLFCILHYRYCVAFLYRILRKFWFDQSKCSVLTSIYNIYFVRLCVTEYIKIMSEKFHLNTRIFRIHRFKSEFFGTYDFNLAVIFNIIFGVKEFLFEVTAFLFTCYQFIFYIYEVDVR